MIRKLKSYLKNCRRLFVNKLLHFVSMSAKHFIAKQSLVENRPIIDNNNFTFVKLLEENWNSIYDELIEILRFRDLVPSFHEISKEQYKISKGNKWKTFAFFSFGHKFKYNCAYAPNTVKLLECIPNLQSAWFSVIAPGYHIPKHKGITRGILRGHLGLSIPAISKECFMDIGNNRIYWQQGKVVVFDDTFEHAVWNNTDQERIVLLFDFDRPMKNTGRYIHETSMKIFRQTEAYKDGVNSTKKIEKSFNRKVPSR
ncbi:MAG: aspartyl/asparaginyl beta-hydroxylase domain-containing protein [bacterium TMED46]|nr:MAG: aspartyl/asparaginyl beta-hydroxylase domain-containing protein [bacterium TMED46]